MAKDTQRLSSPQTEKLEVGETENLESPQRQFPVSFTLNQVVDHRYQVLNMLGQPSGEAWVYLCKDSIENSRVVLKLYHSDFKPKIDLVSKLVQIEHPDIVNVRGYGQVGDQFYEVLDYAEGGSLIDRLVERPFTEKELVTAVIPQVLNGLKFFHSQGIVHRDIKPANIFYTDKNRTDIVIGDFGASTELDQGMSVKKSSGKMTYDYAAPELFLTEEKKDSEGKIRRVHYVGKEVDFYALGITLMHLLSGDTPFPGLDFGAVMRIHCNERISPPDSASKKFKKLISGLLIKERKERWGASEIERWLRGEDVPVYEDKFGDGIRVKPYEFSTTIKARTVKELAVLLQTYEDREVVKKRVAKGGYSQWLYSFDQMLADKVANIEENTRDLDLAVLEISYALDPSLPYVLMPGREAAKTPEDLARIIDCNWNIGKRQIFQGMISVWLRQTNSADLLTRLETIRKEYGQQQDRGVEVFLELLGLPPPAVKTEVSGIEPSILPPPNVVIDSTAGEAKQNITLSNYGERGYLFGEVRFVDEVDGLTLLTNGVESKGLTISLLPGESLLFELRINVEKLQPGKRYESAIITSTNSSSDINLPLSFLVDYPAFSKKRAKAPINGRFYTLKDLSDSYYDELINKNNPVENFFDGEKLISWISGQLDEKPIAEKAENILRREEAFSERFFRVLKSWGTLDENRLLTVFRKLREKELEFERSIAISQVNRDIAGRVRERMSRAFRQDIRRYLAWFGGGLGLLGAILLGSSLGPLAIVVGGLVGVAIGLVTKSVQANQMERLPEEERELVTRTEMAEQEFIRKRAGIETEIAALKTNSSATKPISQIIPKIETPRINVEKPVAALVLTALTVFIIGSFYTSALTEKLSGPTEKPSGAAVMFTIVASENTSVDLRSGPSKSERSLGTLRARKGEIFDVLDTQGDWYRLGAGWIPKNALLAKTNVVPPPPPGAPQIPNSSSPRSSESHVSTEPTFNDQSLGQEYKEPYGSGYNPLRSSESGKNLSLASVRATLSESGYGDLVVEMHGGVVTIGGLVDTIDDVNKVRSIVLTIPGVKGVSTGKLNVRKASFSSQYPGSVTRIARRIEMVLQNAGFGQVKVETGGEGINLVGEVDSPQDLRKVEDIVRKEGRGRSVPIKSTVRVAGTQAAPNMTPYQSAPDESKTSGSIAPPPKDWNR
jgi:serine/threonine protein kinase